MLSCSQFPTTHSDSAARLSRLSRSRVSSSVANVLADLIWSVPDPWPFSMMEAHASGQVPHDLSSSEKSK